MVSRTTLWEPLPYKITAVLFPIAAFPLLTNTDTVTQASKGDATCELEEQTLKAGSDPLSVALTDPVALRSQRSGPCSQFAAVQESQ